MYVADVSGILRRIDECRRSTLLSSRLKATMNRRMRRMMISRIAWAGTAARLIAGASFDASGQELEPRAYSPTPSGVNFLGLTYLRSTGGVGVDPSLPLDNVSAEINIASLGYARTFGLLGRSASVGLVLPYSRADVSGDVFEQQRAVTRSGLADPRLRLAINLFGGPAVIGKSSPPVSPPPHWARASRSWRRSGNMIPIA